MTVSDLLSQLKSLKTIINAYCQIHIMDSIALLAGSGSSIERKSMIYESGKLILITNK